MCLLGKMTPSRRKSNRPSPAKTQSTFYCLRNIVIVDFCGCSFTKSNSDSGIVCLLLPSSSGSSAFSTLSNTSIETYFHLSKSIRASGSTAYRKHAATEKVALCKRLARSRKPAFPIPGHSSCTQVCTALQ